MSAAESEGDDHLIGAREGSAWLDAAPGLAEAAQQWQLDLARSRPLDARAARWTNPGVPSLTRVARHMSSIPVADARWLAGQTASVLSGAGSLLSADGLRCLTDAALDSRHTLTNVAERSLAGLAREQLAALGPYAAELARVLESADGFAPSALVEELRTRPVQTTPLSVSAVQAFASRRLGRAVQVSGKSLGTTPLSQVHAGHLPSLEPVLLRVHRPSAAAELEADTRILATLMQIAGRLRPSLSQAPPAAVLRMTARLAVEESDLRHDALNTVELALAVERAAPGSVRILHPLPGLVVPHAVAFEGVDGARSLATNAGPIDSKAVLAALLAVTLESALNQGVYHADPRAEHFVVQADGSLALVGCTILGRLSRETRQALRDYLIAIVSGDVPGQVSALMAVGVVPDDADLDALIRDLTASPSLTPTALLKGGDTALASVLKDSVRLFAKHRLELPLEVLLFVRSVFALRSTLAQVTPDLTLMHALFTLLPRVATLWKP